ncbi:MAG: hypothetical protein ACLSVD_13040 [Eggerthellaceae bacterium]
MAERAEGCSTVIALGGDGVIHEVAGELMRQPGCAAAGARRDTRRIGQRLRALGVSTKVDEACAQLLGPSASCGRRARERPLVRGDALVRSGRRHRARHDGAARAHRPPGTVLYMESGIDQLLHHLDLRRYRVSFDQARRWRRNPSRSPCRSGLLRRWVQIC